MEFSLRKTKLLFNLIWFQYAIKTYPYTRVWNYICTLEQHTHTHEQGRTGQKEIPAVGHAI